MTGKVAVVTGASRGIGRAVAERFARDGARVVVNYARSGDQAEQVVAGIRERGGEAIAVQADMGRPEQIAQLFKQTTERFGRLDVLVNNAGAYDAHRLERSDEAHYAALFDVNVRGVLLASREAARRFGETGGRIINISSGAARAAVPGGAVYAASKAAVEALTRCHAAELGPRGITVNAVAPGFTESDMLDVALPAEARDGMIALTALGRLGRPEDIADVVAFLTSDDARWITGETIGASGGLRA
ncbi:MAG: glucose 1-dehydrogenase [Gemmatimonadota bacterium]|nr:glucose 1-dehydrogenase [Gemmatimonadota bacterium]